MATWTSDGGRLDGYGDRPPNAPNCDILIYICALIAVPVFVFLFSNLMKSADAPAGVGFIGYLVSLPLMGKLLFGTFKLAKPAHVTFKVVAIS